MGVALGEGKLIKTLLGAIPKDVADLIDKRAICRKLTYAQVRESVLREVNRRVNRNVPDHVFLKNVNTSASLYGFSYAHSCYVQGVCVAANGYPWPAVGPNFTCGVQCPPSACTCGFT